MAEIHVQARKHSRANPATMWIWLIIGALIIAAVVYYVYMNKNKNNSNNNTQDLKNQRNTPQPGAMVPQKQGSVYVMNAA